MSVLLICVRSCTGSALWDSLPPCHYSQCAPCFGTSCYEYAYNLFDILLWVCFWMFPATLPLLSVCSCFGSSCYECALNVCELLLWVCHGMFTASVPLLYCKCAPALIPPAMSVLLICATSCSWIYSLLLVRGWCDSAKSLCVDSVYSRYSRIHLADFMFYVYI
jgi:hypothetical protein